MTDDEWDAYLRDLAESTDQEYGYSGYDENFDWFQAENQPYEIDIGELLPGQEGYGWRYFSDGTAISPAGAYYYGGQQVYSPQDSSPFDSLLTSALKKLPGQLVDTAKSVMFKPDGGLNLAALGTLASAVYGARGGNQIQPGGGGGGGYTAPVPKLTMVRERVAHDDTGRRPGAQGRDYFTAPAYVPQGAAPAQPATTMAEGGEVPQFKGPLQSGGFVVPGDVVRHADPAGSARKEAGLQALHSAMGAQAIRGPGDAMSDSIPTSIDGRRPAAVANGEAYVPPERVAEIGGGSMKRGSERLYEMMDRLRMERTGSKKQINPDNPRELARAYQGGPVEKFNAGGTTGTGTPLTTPVSYGMSQSSTLAPWAGEYVTTALGQGAAAADEPFQAYKGPLTAGPSALQQQAFAGAQGIASAGYTPAQFTGGIFGTAEAQQYMNPYLQGALDPQLRELKRQSDIARLDDAGRLTKAGAFGGSRQAIMESEGRRNLLDQQSKVIGEGYRTAFDRAADLYDTDRQARMRAEQDTERSRQFGADFGLKSIADLANLGTVQRGIESEGIAADKAAFEEQRDRPLQMAQYKMDLLGGLPQGTTSTPNTTGLGSLQSQLSNLLATYNMLKGLG
jgi:hypothetical protein